MAQKDLCFFTCLFSEEEAEHLETSPNLLQMTLTIGSNIQFIISSVLIQFIEHLVGKSNMC